MTKVVNCQSTGGGIPMVVCTMKCVWCPCGVRRCMYLISLSISMFLQELLNGWHVTDGSVVQVK